MQQREGFLREGLSKGLSLARGDLGVRQQLLSRSCPGAFWVALCGSTGSSSRVACQGVGRCSGPIWVAETPLAAARLVREGGQQRPSVHCPPHSRTRGHLRLGRAQAPTQVHPSCVVGSVPACTNDHRGAQCACCHRLKKQTKKSLLGSLSRPPPAASYYGLSPP